jgi:hypothetical protein
MLGGGGPSVIAADRSCDPSLSQRITVANLQVPETQALLIGERAFVLEDLEGGHLVHLFDGERFGYVTRRKHRLSDLRYTA